MKQQYEPPVMEIIDLEPTDIITASGDPIPEGYGDLDKKDG